MQQPMIGDYCETTHTIVIISPFPHTLQELVAPLTAKCYDVLVFHHLDEQALGKLPIDLLILDQTREINAPVPQPAVAGVSTVLLVDGEAEHGEGKDSADVFPWPAASVEPVLERIHELLQEGGRGIIASAEQVRLKDLYVDFKRMSVYLGSARIDVTKTEFDLLKALLDTRGSVLSRQELMDRVWGDQYFGGSNTVDVHVKSLRQKLKDNPKLPKYIETVRGVGYRLAD
ncbi:winged helix-turn-helix transcriptional regulator [Paenibacillus rigui]|uniref:Transcriptional regulator n=1 Tax=Paenibacillus rigui TaxID=554312 RepID=A0A229UK29_9BACL|nr:winged-helix domain-containing protein [Paenibacillus rigui]OXM83752.1 transcriptional regulator [Paenibacillus rigui]